MSQRMDFCPEYISAKIMILHVPAVAEQNKITQVYVQGREMLLQFASCRTDDDVEITQDLLLRAPTLVWITVMKNNRIVKECSTAPAVAETDD